MTNKTFQYNQALRTLEQELLWLRYFS